MYNITNLLRDILINKFDNYKLLSVDMDTSNHFIHIKANDTIIYRNDNACDVFILLKGVVLVNSGITWGDETSFDTLRPINILGFVEMLANCPIYTANIIAQTDCTFLKIPIDKFSKILQNNNDICYQCLKLLGEVAISNMNLYELNVTTSHRDILGHFMYNYALRNGEKCVYSLTRNELALSLNMNLRTLHRCVGKLAKDNFLTINKGKIHITKSNFINLKERYGHAKGLIGVFPTE